VGVPPERELLERLYEAALAPHRWPEFLESFAERLRGEGAVVWIRRRGIVGGGISYTARRDPAFQQRYEEYFVRRDVWAEATAREPIGHPVVCRDVVPRPSLERTEFWNDWCRPQGIGHATAMVLDKDDDGGCDGVLGLLRPAGARPFSRADLDVQGRLAPHLLRVVKIRRTIDHLEADRTTMRGALDRQALGVIVVDVRGRIQLANALAAEVLATGDGLRAGPKGLAASTPEDTAALTHMIASATVRAEPSGGVLMIARGPTRRPLHVMIAPTGSLPETVAARAIVFVADPERQVNPPEALLRATYGLTAAEARLAAGLAQGFGVVEAARRLGITPNTARTQLKTVFAKLGVDRQAGLVRLLMAGVTGLRAAPRPPIG
jgi:DNA-binding CsgD family transcriptional regulator/PAS domain-containing protein